MTNTLKWGFYGRNAERTEIETILKGRRFFFCSMSGRRRIGKTTLIRTALEQSPSLSALYVQIPDSDERGVVQTFRDAVEDSGPLTNIDGQPIARPGVAAIKDFRSMASTISKLCRAGAIVVLDEFQYFHRKVLNEFTSHLQAEIDNIRRTAGADKATGGLFVLGSIHTEMTAILEDRNSPLFNRITDHLEIKHWNFATLFEMFDAHQLIRPEERLFFWSLFEGVPKFYRDAFDRGVLHPNSGRSDILRTLFFEGASPLRDEAANWFLRELRGRYDTILKLLARLQPCSYGRLVAEYREDGHAFEERELIPYLKTLSERYRMIEPMPPMFAKKGSRKTRYEITDNFLSAWLAALSRNVDLSRIRPIDEAVGRADIALQTYEGFAFERMIRLLTQEASKTGSSDFALSEVVRAYWNKADNGDIEIDLIALNEDDKEIRFGSCKRRDAAHDSAALTKFNAHIDRFLSSGEGKRYKHFRIQRALYSPSFSAVQRHNLENKGYVCLDLADFAQMI